MKTMNGVMFVEQGQAAIIEEPMPVCTEDTMLARVECSGGAVRIFDTLRDAPSELLGTVFVVGHDPTS